MFRRGMTRDRSATTRGRLARSLNAGTTARRQRSALSSACPEWFRDSRVRQHRVRRASFSFETPRTIQRRWRAQADVAHEMGAPKASGVTIAGPAPRVNTGRVTLEEERTMMATPDEKSGPLSSSTAERNGGDRRQ